MLAFLIMHRDFDNTSLKLPFNLLTSIKASPSLLSSNFLGKTSLPRSDFKSSDLPLFSFDNTHLNIFPKVPSLRFLPFGTNYVLLLQTSLLNNRNTAKSSSTSASTLGYAESPLGLWFSNCCPWGGIHEHWNLREPEALRSHRDLLKNSGG